MSQPDARARNEEQDEVHDHDRGLAFDVATLFSRRRALAMMGGAGLAALAACRSPDPKPATSGPSSSAPQLRTTSPLSGNPAAGNPPTEQIPAETPGPFPGYGSSGIVRSDITKSYGFGSATAAGVPLVMKLRVLDIRNGRQAVAGRGGLCVAVRHGGALQPLLRGRHRRELPARCAGNRR